MSDTKLEKFLFAHAIKENCISEINGARRAILPVFKMGKTDLVDNRSFKMEEQDFALLKANLSTKQTPTPVLFEHGEGPRGGKAGGKVISLQLKDGEIFAHASLTKPAYQEVKDEEWLSCSGGFLASRDEEGNIRPVELLEVSFTNLPAFPGLSDIQTFGVLVPKELPVTEENKGTESQVEVTPTPPLEEPVTLEAAPVEEPVAAVEQIPEPTPEPIPEPVVLEASNPPVGEVIAAMQGQIDALKDLVNQLLAPPAPAASEMPMDMAMEAVPEEEVVELTAEQGEAIINMAAEAKAEIKYEAKIKSDLIQTILTTGEKDGKIVPANKQAAVKLANSDPESFKVFLATAKPIAPTQTIVKPSNARVDIGLLDTSPEREAEILTKALQLQVKHPELTLTELSSIVKKYN